MKKILIKVQNDNDFIDSCDGYIIGFSDFSILFNKKYDLDDIKRIIKKYPDKQIFVCLNSPVLDSEINKYKKALKELDKLALAGLIIGDVAALTYELKTNIILDFFHLNNSYLTINHYYNHGASGVFLTNDITKDEINEIKDKTNALLFKQVFGFTHLSSSYRKFVSNYLDYFKIVNKNDNYYEISEDGKEFYKIIEDDNMCHILSSHILNLFSLKDEINSDYFVIDGFLFNGNIKDVVNTFIKNDTANNDEITKKYNTTTGFINQKTIYKVINDEQK